MNPRLEVDLVFHPLPIGHPQRTLSVRNSDVRILVLGGPNRWFDRPTKASVRLEGLDVTRLVRGVAGDESDDDYVLERSDGLDIAGKVPFGIANSERSPLVFYVSHGESSLVLDTQW